MSDRSQSNPIDLPKFWAPVDSSRAAFLAANAIVMGNVSIEHGVSIWYGAIVRGDVERIEIGTGTNTQDGAVIHCDPGTPTIMRIAGITMKPSSLP